MDTQPPSSHPQAARVRVGGHLSAQLSLCWEGGTSLSEPRRQFPRNRALNLFFQALVWGFNFLLGTATMGGSEMRDRRVMVGVSGHLSEQHRPLPEGPGETSFGAEDEGAGWRWRSHLGRQGDRAVRWEAGAWLTPGLMRTVRSREGGGLSAWEATEGWTAKAFLDRTPSSLTRCLL